MKKILLGLAAIILSTVAFAQPDVSLRVVQSNFNSADPDGAGPATGTVTVRFELMSTIPVQVDGFAVGFAFQSANLMPTSPLSPIVPLGALAPLNWSSAGNFVGNDIPGGSITYDGKSYDKRMIIAFNQASTGLLMDIGTTWGPVAEVTYWTKAATPPQGGNILVEPGTIVFQHSASADGGFTEYPFLSPGFPAGIPLGGAVAPVLFSQFKATCSPNGTLINWKTAQESNSSYFEVERSVDGNTWVSLGRTAAAGNSSTDRSYNQIDLEAGNAMYRVKQVDKDGQFIYTGIERANCQVKNITSVIYPVPAQSELNVVIKSDRALNTQLIIFDATGRAVRRENVNIQNGSNNFKINLNGLSSGEYLLKSTNVELDLRKQFSIIR